MAASVLLPDSMGAAGREPVLLLLVAFLVTFVLTRAYTRLARVRGWGSGSVGEVHLHHMTIGIVLVLVSGLIAVAVRPVDLGLDLVAIVFGIGAAFTLDEFALWLYLRDVYWCPEGRSSIDAAVMGVLLAGLLLVGTSPFGIGDDSGVFGCMSLLACHDVCPKDLPLQTQIAFIRRKMVAMGWK